MDKIPYIGCTDNQTAEQKEKNIKLVEIVAAIAPVEWKEKTDWTTYPIRNQDGSSQCVCMTLATEMGIIFKQKYGEFIDFSSSFPYKQRGGSYGGCTSNDVYNLFPGYGNVFESILPSQNLSESQVEAIIIKNYLKDLAIPFTIGRVESPIDFETAASTVQATGKGVMVWFRFSHEEWTSIPQVLPQPTTSGHSVTVVDFLLGNAALNAKYGINLVIGKKYLVIQDSWGLSYAVNGYRFISEEYFKARCFLESYLKAFQKITMEEQIALDLPFFDGTIVSAQKCFLYEGFFPKNVDFVEKWGPTTRSSCIDFQKKYGILPALGNFGPITKAKLLELYGKKK